MTGFRIGWTIAPASIISAMEKLQSHSTSGASSVLQEGAFGALQSGHLPIQTLKKFIQENRDILINQLKAIPGIKLAEPQGTFYCFPDLRGIHPDSETLATHLLDKAFVSTVPGIAFGMEGYLRLSYTCSKEEITESAARIRWAVDPGSPREIIINGQKQLRDWETLQ
jgi:aspartate/methionine/tyrosine aminotransferase